MSSSKAGRRFERDVVGDLDVATPDHVHVIPPGFSGNHRVPAGDVHIYDTAFELTEYDGDISHVIELKRSSRDTFPIREFTAEGEEVDQLTRFYGPRTRCYIGMKFNRRELALVELTDDSRPIQSLIENAPDCFNARYSEQSDTFRFDDPWTNDREAWPSAQAGRSDIRVIADTTGVSLLE